jgi:hypothetical protein
MALVGREAHETRAPLVAPEHVELLCVREGASKLRVRITSAGYNRDANVQFPEDMRVEGRRFRVPAGAVRFGPVGKKFFYRVLQRGVIQEVEGGGAERAGHAGPAIARVFDVTEGEECAICWTAPKDVVLGPCGHFCMCAGCADGLRECPMCRTVVTLRVPRAQLG